MMSLLRIGLATVAAGLTLTPHVKAQTAAPATYDVSIIKPASPDAKGMMLDWAHAQFKADNITVQWLMTAAFHARKDQIIGEPGWVPEQRFDVTAKLLDLDAGTVDKMTYEQHRALLLALLVERFGLKYHVETKELPIYELAPAKKGLKLTRAADSGDTTKQVYGMCSGCASWGNHAVAAHDLQIAAFAELLASQVERDVNDRTGFTGKIDVSLKWAPDLGSKPLSDEDAALPPLAQALEEQMGLRLIPARGPVKLYVIDHLEKPSAN